MSKSPFLQLHEADTVVVARDFAPQGSVWTSPDGKLTVTAKERIELGHKMAIVPLPKGTTLLKFGQPIGFSTIDIAPGDWVHSHNLDMMSLHRDFEFGTAIHEPPAPATPRTFMGYRRQDGRAATRNYVAIVSTVNCSATSANYIVDAFDEALLAEFPNIDGVIALNHKSGCSFRYTGPDHQMLARTLGGFARHPNIGAYIILGLGCETGQASFLAEEYDLVTLDNAGSKSNRPLIMNIQDLGGVKKTVQQGIAALKDLLPAANQVQRMPIPISELILGTNCGGSDGSSGVTANPALGVASDLLVAHGGTSALAETTEIYGGEHLLTRRAVSREVGEKLIERIRWWEEYAAKFGAKIDNNPSVGNKKGGLTTIFEKSLGAISKAGTAPLRAVYEYSEPMTEKGFVIMDTPGFDPASVTGLVAGGANIVIFTTGRGSCFGCKPVPSIKVSTNTPIYDRMIDDMDLNAGTILDGEKTVEEVGLEIFEEMIAVASGKKTKSELQGIGDEEFCPWMPGPIF
ncbi:UxaA family hydrolase [Planctomicrobium piriforme]|uniref:Altronate hydrolase n=1 Tax=Planctomicrobium piriforme TaxID=1576369 RepID=A0A1I3HYN2_9PLAN|nr:altronate dehydratase family protein [Planctomicrobium piriforme]SFI40752.1 altronate hydrolase [Planctomicrobium piriforme]